MLVPACPLRPVQSGEPVAAAKGIRCLLQPSAIQELAFLTAPIAAALSCALQGGRVLWVCVPAGGVAGAQARLPAAGTGALGLAGDGLN